MFTFFRSEHSVRQLAFIYFGEVCRPRKQNKYSTELRVVYLIHIADLIALELETVMLPSNWVLFTVFTRRFHKSSAVISASYKISDVQVPKNVRLGECVC